MSERTCTAEGCERRHLARGFCAMHYKRFMRYSDPADVRDMSRAAFSRPEPTVYTATEVDGFVYGAPYLISPNSDELFARNELEAERNKRDWASRYHPDYERLAAAWRGDEAARAAAD